MLCVQVKREQVTLSVCGGATVAAWTQPDHHRDHVEVVRSHDGAVALVAVGDRVTVVRLADGEIVWADTSACLEAALPLDAARTLEVTGPVEIDEGFSGHFSTGVGFWTDDADVDPAAWEATKARYVAELEAAARQPVHRRLAIRGPRGTVLVHEATVAPVDGGEVLLWPPVAGPEGVLLRHAIVKDEGQSSDTESQPPWLVRDDGTLTQLPFELGVSPLQALPGDCWLLPGRDPLWRDDYDEPVSILDAAGRAEPVLIDGAELSPSRVLAVVAPELLAALDPPAPNQDVAWEVVGAYLDDEELRVAIEVTIDDEHAVIVVAGTAPMRELARVRTGPDERIAVAL
jgi:hypothetical protein